MAYGKHDAKHIPNPATHHAAGERNNRLAESMSDTHEAESQPYSEPSAKGHPALKHLKQANHVQEVFKKR